MCGGASDASERPAFVANKNMPSVFSYPPQNSADTQSLSHELQSRGYACIKLEMNQREAIDDSIGSLAGAKYDQFRKHWWWEGTPWDHSDDEAGSSTQLLLSASGAPGGFSIVSGIKEYSHFGAADPLPADAKGGCTYLEEVAMRSLLATGVTSQLATTSRVTRRSSPSGLTAGGTKLQAYRYFKQGAQEGAELACPEHVDSGLLTLVVHRGEGGLEVYDQLDEQWVGVEKEFNPRLPSEDMDVGDEPNNIPHARAVLLVGHTLEAASGGEFRAVLHRVKSPRHKMRLSLVLKLNLKGDLWLPEVTQLWNSTCTASDTDPAPVAPPQCVPFRSATGRRTLRLPTCCRRSNGRGRA